MKLVFLSDTHSLHGRVDVPEGDILIHTGDLCGRSDLENVNRFAMWLKRQPHKHKVVIAGNHDWPFQRMRQIPEGMIRDAGAHYLEDSMVEIGGLKIYGTPWQPAFGNWAFNLPENSPQLLRKWQMIPAGIDVLLTHCPPRGIRDFEGHSLGCMMLRAEVLERIKPRVHAFGHIHQGYGKEEVEGITFVNGSICTPAYQPDNAPITLELDVAG